MEAIRLIVYKNQKSPKAGKNILISPTAIYEEILDECCKALGDHFKLIFDERGKQVNSISGLRDGCSLYLSKGEAFQALTQNSRIHEPTFVMLGAAGVGKSALTIRFIRNIFVEDYDPTIEDFYKHTTIIKGQAQKISILDTAGMEDYEPLIEEWLNHKQGIFLVFSLELEDSFEKIRKYYEKILHKYKNNMPVIALVGNKNDLQRKVAFESARKMSEMIKCRYYEVSAVTGEGINEMFLDVIEQIRNRSKPVSIPWYRRCCLL
jgi:small GTP-binding protein